jgi:hypothetical protein
MTDQRPGTVLSDVGAVALAQTMKVRRLADALAGVFQLPLHPLAKLAVPVETAELGTGGLLCELRAPAFVAQRRPVDSFSFAWCDRMAPALAIFWILQIIDMRFLPRWLKPTATGWQPPARVTERDKARVPRRCGRGGRKGLVQIMQAFIVANRGAILAPSLI